MDYSLFINMQTLNASMYVHFQTRTRRCICNNRDKQSVADFVTIDKYILLW